MSIVIREAGVEDAEAIARLHVVSWRVAYQGIIHQSYLESPLDSNESTQRRELRINQGGTKTFVAEKESKMLGFVDVGASRDDGLEDQAEIYSLYLAPDKFRAGIGTILFDHAIDQISKWKFKTFYLWTLENNNRGRKFYERSGGILSGETRDAVIDNVPYQQVQYRWDNINA